MTHQTPDNPHDKKAVDYLLENYSFNASEVDSFLERVGIIFEDRIPGEAERKQTYREVTNNILALRG